MPIYRSLLGLPDPEVSDGVSAIKPLECVGTVDEARQSLLLAAERHKANLLNSNDDQRCKRCSQSVVAARTDLERERLPRNLQAMLNELGALGVGSTPGSLEALHKAHIDDLNAAHNIPGWLLPGCTESSAGSK